jgi:hypothetical protein
MSEITTIGLDLAKHVFRFTVLMRRVRRFCVSDCGAEVLQGREELSQRH